MIPFIELLKAKKKRKKKSRNKKGVQNGHIFRRKKEMNIISKCEKDKKVGFLYTKWYTTINGKVPKGQTERLGYIYETV